MNDTKEKHILVGFAVDVSGSMSQSIRNESRKDVNRFESFKDALRKLSRKTREKIDSCRKEGFKASVDVFAYVFGLRIFPNCDFLSLIHLRKKNAKKSDLNFSGNSNPYRELVNIAIKNGIEDMEGFEGWIKDVLDTTDEAIRLVIVLNQYPSIAKHIAKLLPKNIKQAKVAETRNTISKVIKYGKWGLPGWLGLKLIRTVPIIALPSIVVYGIFAAKTAENAIEDKDLTKAKSLAKELANASSDGDIIEIAIREIGQEQFGRSLYAEVRKYGETLMPLEKLADLLETQEKELNKIEPFIYGNTPMGQTLGLIKRRFEKELTKTPDNTIPLLFILSDGAPTDGDPLPIADSIKNEGIRIVSCLITDEDLIFPRTLFNEIQPEWSREAVLMYNMASSLDENSVFAGSLKEHGWRVPVRSKMFVQVNHSEVLDEFIQIVLDPIRR